ncbi:MAG TPA: hypothetical protein DDW27_21020 [Bacteroidales bacterium]|nr:hypothetical protein [Bacteroidales bacterium]
MKKFIINISLIILIAAPGYSQQQDLKREVTLYNPYIPSLSDFKKKSFLPVIDDTVVVRPEFTYTVNTNPYSPEYSIVPIKAASLVPDPLEKLYKSYVNLGFGNYLAPLAEVSVTNERSKSGAYGIYARHFSTNGKVKLQNNKRVYAGYMDNDASLFGKKFFMDNYLEGSIDYARKTRYAYGYDTSLFDYEADKKDIRILYNKIGASLSFASLTLDSSDFSYDFDMNYGYFFNNKTLLQHNSGLSGAMAKNYRDLYIGSGLGMDFYRPSKEITGKLKYVVSLSPFISKSSTLWNFRLGMQLLVDKDTLSSAKFHLYPDVKFAFDIVPSYISFFAGLGGKLEQNTPEKVIEENPFMLRDGTLYMLPNTSHQLILSGGLKGNTGIGGNYLISASYSMITDMLFYSNLVFYDPLFESQVGNLFFPIQDDAELFNLHGEINGVIGDKITYSGSANYYNYKLGKNEYPWSKQPWDGKLGVKYNLRNKIIAGIDVTALGKRRFISWKNDLYMPPSTYIFKSPLHINANLSAEYRYTKILSFWLKVNNIAVNRNYDWAFYPTQRFMCMAGLTYSL